MTSRDLAIRSILCLLLVAMLSHVAIADWSNAPNRALSQIDDYVDLTGHRRSHILNRHRAGAGRPGKTEFPASWSNDRILHHVSDIATDPKAVTGVGKWNSPYAIGTRDGIQIRVDFYPPTHPKHAGKVSTAYPVNTPANLN